MIKTLLNNRSRTITFAAFILAVSTLGSKILGLFRDRVLAGKFGAGDELDMYYAAFRIPDMVYSVLILGAVSAAFIPVFSEYLEKNKKAAWRLASNVLTLSLLGLVVLSFVLILLSPWIVPLVAPGFEGDKLSLTIWLTRFMFLSPFLFGLSSILGGVLQVFRRFLIYSLAPIFYNIGIIIGALWLTDLFESMGLERLFGLVAGVILGALLHVIIQIPSTISSGFHFRFVWDTADAGFRKMVRLFIPRTIGLAVYQINFIVITAIASTLSVGSIAVFNLANNLQYLPIGIFGISFATAAFPALSRRFSRNELDGLKNSFSNTFRNILFFVVPFSIFFFLLRAQIVRVVLGTGEFGWEDTRLTAAALGIFALSIFAQSLIPLLARTFYAFQDTRTPVMISIVSVVLNIALSFWFVRVLSSGNIFQTILRDALDLKDLPDVSLLGLIVAFSMSSLVYFLLLIIFLSFRIGLSAPFKIIFSFIRISFAGMTSGGAVFVALQLLSSVFDLNTFSGVFLQLLGAIGVGICVYVLILFILKAQELRDIIGTFRREFSPRSNLT